MIYQRQIDIFKEAIDCKKENEMVINEGIKILGKLARSRQPIPKQDVKELYTQLKRATKLGKRIDKALNHITKDLIEDAKCS